MILTEIDTFNSGTSLIHLNKFLILVLEFEFDCVTAFKKEGIIVDYSSSDFCLTYNYYLTIWLFANDHAVVFSHG